MATSIQRLEEVLTEAGVSVEAAPSVVAELQRFVEEAIAAGTETRPTALRPGGSTESLESRMVRMEQKIDDLQTRTEHLYASTEHWQARTEHLHAMTEQKIAQTEQKIDDLQTRTEHLYASMEHWQARTEHLHAMTEQRIAQTEQKIDGLHELMTVQFAHVDHRFKAIDDRLDRERRERWGFVTAAAGAITAGLLRVFGAI